MSDLRTFAERIERILRFHADEAEIRAAITGSDDRHRYVLEPLVPLLKVITPPATRAFTAAGRMLGCSTDGARHRAAIWRRRGSFEAARDWRIDLCGEPWPVCELPDGCVGFVYLVEAERYPGLFKVGFSRSPDDRADRLSRDCGSPLRLRAQWPATWVDEHIAHVALHPFAMANEWFDATGTYAGHLPAARFYTPARMWSELKSSEDTKHQPAGSSAERDPQSAQHGSDSVGGAGGDSPVHRAGSEQESAVEPQARNEPGSVGAASGGERFRPLPETRPIAKPKPAEIDLTIPASLDRRVKKPEAA